MNSSNCISEFGNPDVTGIGVRIAWYMTVFQVLLFYSLAAQNHAKMALWQTLLVLLGTHFTVFLSIRSGTLDSYTLTVVIHQALLIAGAQFIHLLTFQRKSWHRWLYVANTLSALVEFTISNLWPAWINRNSNYCPTLTDAISAVRKERERWTVFILALSFILSLLDVTVRIIDIIRNKNVDRKKGDHSIPTLPRCILWDRNSWNRRRKAYLTLGILFYLLSIYNVEFNIIRYFHEVVQQVGGLSSTENRWGFGQVTAIFIASIALGVTVRHYLIYKSVPFAKKTKKVEAGIEEFADDDEKRRVALWTWIYSRLTRKQPRIRGGDALRRRVSYSSAPQHSPSFANGSSATSSTTVFDHNARPIQRMNNTRGNDVKLEPIKSDLFPKHSKPDCPPISRSLERCGTTCTV